MYYFFIVILSILCSTVAVAAQPQETVEQFHESLLAVMRAEVGFDERSQRLHPLVEQNFDLQTIARISLGASWRKLDEKQRRQFIDELHGLITATYADRFKRFNKHRFVTRDVSDAGPGRSLVKTELHRVDGDTVRLDYYLVDGRMFNVVADGVSDLSVRRSEYTAILRRDGFDGLLQDIRQKIAEYQGADET